MHTLQQLKDGQLQGITRLQLSEELTEFPLEILSLSDTLEILDLSNNQLSELPQEITQLDNLRIIFMSNNHFTELPEVLGQCTKLEMVGFKSNQIAHVPEASLPLQLRWLILTDNQIVTLPQSLGERPRLQKLALAGNKLTHLPDSMRQLTNLQLLRISANSLSSFPEPLLHLPKLAWLAFSGNPFCQVEGNSDSVPTISSDSYVISQLLGQGASGVISQAAWLDNPHHFPEHVAVKVFKGEVTSDGYPSDELLACLKTGFHPNLVKSIAQVLEPDHLALVMELIPSAYKNLGLPPSLETCTRDTFVRGYSLSVDSIAVIVQQMLDVFSHLHKNKVCHGDLYAHNVLVNEQAQMIFGDFGAASVYENLPVDVQDKVRQIEMRALGYFIEDLLSVCEKEEIDNTEYQRLQLLAKSCFSGSASW
ncbi:leucine-rich repeat-containing serine/threonine-protein kinase [Vibrio sp. Of7-15]|uniref:leucine-rich repeat-containing protein kinase family protein n=1 Tax=Vibrio sp. Of7-15 TaxID=2724879 RepID=UPI001EF3746E|nr:leucine-rich repeat-containing protein kinase family protein [Vibrio sp. Of7-15]MCG7499315.1 leucine-rich repeat-containing serine/threonine-protein kinase [Vibrio sp. Of7-15]